MILQGVFLTEGDAELFSRALAEVKTRYVQAPTRAWIIPRTKCARFKLQNRCENRTRA